MAENHEHAPSVSVSATGDRAVAVGPGAHHLVVVTGDGNVVTVNAEEQVSDELREARLNQAARTARALMLERWLAWGVTTPMAESLADDTSIGIPPGLPQQMAQPFTALIGDFGAGKTLYGLRIHARDCHEVLNGDQTVLPIYLPARAVRDRSLVELVSAQGRYLGVEAAQVTARVVIDGIDEVGHDRANELLAEARVLAHSAPGNRVLVTARPGFDVNDDERIDMPLLSEEEVEALVTRICGHGPSYSWPSPLREAVRRPLFAVIAAVLVLERWAIPTTKAGLLSEIVGRVLGRSHFSVTSELARLASMTLPHGGRVSDAEFGNDQLVAALLDTRLVVRRFGALAFALPILEQYFASIALLEGHIKIDRFLGDLVALDTWRYAFVLALGAGSHERVSELLDPLVSRHAGAAARFVNEAIAESAPIREDPPPLPDELECARRLHFSCSAWVKGIGPVANLANLARQDGMACSVSARHEGKRLVVGIAYPESEFPIAGVLPEGVHPLLSPAPSDYQHLRSATPGPEPAWAWRWTLRHIQDRLAEVIHGRALPTLEGPLHGESMWKMAKLLSGKRSSLLQVPLPVAQIRERTVELLELIEYSDLSSVHFGSAGRVRGAELKTFAELLEQHEDSHIRSPWVSPDRRPGSGYVRDFYSPETLRTLVEQVYSAGLEGYRQLADIWFAPLVDTLGLRAAMPVEFRGQLIFGEQDNMRKPEFLDYSYSLLPMGDFNQVSVTVSEERPEAWWKTDEEFEAHRADELHRIRAWRPQSAPHVHLPTGSTVLHVYELTPATNLAYRLLWDDLASLGLVKGTFR